MARAIRTGKSDLEEARGAAEVVTKLVFQKLGEASNSVDKPKLFPGGVTVIDVKVKVGTIDVAVRIEGKCDPKSVAADGGFQPA